MARRFISTAKFNPYSYEELARPIEQATAVLAKQAQNTMALEMQNDMLGRYLDPELDKDEYALYDYNRKRLREASDNLMKYGLTTSNYNTFRELANIYARDIRPMQSAAANRANYYTKINELLMSNPDAVVKGPKQRALNEFYNGMPETQIIKGSAVQADVTAAMKALAQARTTTDIKSLNRYNDIVLETTGYTIDEYNKLDFNDPESVFYKIIHDVMRKHGAEDANGAKLLDDADHRKIFDYALNGTQGLLGETKKQIIDNGMKHRESLAQSESHFQQQRIDAARNAAIEMQINGDPRPVNEIAKGLLDGTIDFRQPKVDANRYTVETYPTKNNISTLPVNDIKSVSVKFDGSTSFDYDDMSGTNEYVKTHRAKLNADGVTYNWENIDNPHIFAKGYDRTYADRILRQTLGNNYKDKLPKLTNSEVAAIEKAFDENEKKIQVSDYKFYKDLTNEVGRKILEAANTEFVDEKGKHPTADDLKNAVGYTITYDTSDPTKIAMTVNGKKFNADAGTVFDKFSKSGFETKNAYDQFMVAKKDFQTGRNNTDFWVMNFDQYAAKMSRFSQAAKILLDETITYFGENVQQSNDLDKSPSTANKK